MVVASREEDVRLPRLTVMATPGNVSPASERGLAVTAEQNPEQQGDLAAPE